MISAGNEPAVASHMTIAGCPPDGQGANVTDVMLYRRTATPDHAQRGQGLAEFAIVLPLLFTMIMGVFEFGVAFASNVGVNRASQSAALMASEAGSIRGADCLILDEIEKAILPPNSHSKILDVHVELTNFRGDIVYGANRWVRTGSTVCTVADKLTLTLPYTLASETYPDTQRCNALSGCPTMTPTRYTVDNIAVTVRYHHDWITPLGAALPLNDGSGWEFEQRTVFRMEPHRS